MKKSNRRAAAKKRLKSVSKRLMNAFSPTYAKLAATPRRG